jgi:hypothetical protein
MRAFPFRTDVQRAYALTFPFVSLCAMTSPVVTFGGFERIEWSFWSTTQLEATRVDSSAGVELFCVPSSIACPAGTDRPQAH